MIEVLKQWAEDVSKVYDILAFGHTERALEILAKTRTSLRQAIAEAEKQEPVAYCEIHHLPEPCVQCEKEHEGYNTHPPQRKPLTDEQAMDAYFETPPFGTYKEAFIAGIRFIEAAHGIKGEA